jgi:AraC-like DNA-binding protein
MDKFTPPTTVPISSIRWLVAAGKMAGLDTLRLLQDIGVTTADLSDQQRQLPYPLVASFRNQVMSTIQNEAIALLVGEQLPLGELGIVDYICASSQSVSNAMQNLSRYFSLMSHPDFALSYIEQDQMGLISYGRQNQLSTRQNLFEQQSTEFTFSITLSRIRMLTNSTINSAAVCFRHAAPDYVDEYQRIFQGPIEFEAANNLLILDENCLALSPENPDDRLHQLLMKYADASVNHLPVTSSVAHRVVEEIKRTLQDGELTSESIANRLCMSPRTLHRRLSEENTSFAKLRDQLRCELAQSMLRNAELTITDITYLLGFSQPSAFNRAFKRWTGLTPQLFRDQSSRAGKSITS